MVWSQYVYEASTGAEVDPDSGGDDDINAEHDVALNILDWELQYSDELWDLWDLLRMLLRDAFLENVLLTECSYDDFVLFCFTDYNEWEEYSGEVPYEENVAYMWRVLWNEMKYLGFAPGATFNDFAFFVVEHTDINNLTI
jgi:hypothetical protein